MQKTQDGMPFAAMASPIHPLHTDLALPVGPGWHGVPDPGSLLSPSKRPREMVERWGRVEKKAYWANDVAKPWNAREQNPVTGPQLQLRRFHAVSGRHREFLSRHLSAGMFQISMAA